MTDSTSLTPFFDPKGVIHFINLKGGSLLGNSINKLHSRYIYSPQPLTVNHNKGTKKGRFQ